MDPPNALKALIRLFPSKIRAGVHYEDKTQPVRMFNHRIKRKDYAESCTSGNESEGGRKQDDAAIATGKEVPKVGIFIFLKC